MTASNLINTKFQSVFGWIGLEKSSKGITRCSLPQMNEDICRKEILGWNSNHTVKTDLFSEEIKHINDYLEGKNYSLPVITLDISKEVFRVLRIILSHLIFIMDGVPPPKKMESNVQSS